MSGWAIGLLIQLAVEAVGLVIDKPRPTPAPVIITIPADERPTSTMEDEGGTYE